MHKDETLKKQSMFETLRRVIFENFDNTPQNMESNTNLSQIINKQRAIDVLFFFTQIYIKFDLLDNSNIYALRHKEALTISQLIDAIYDEPKKNTHNDHFITTPTYTRIIACGSNHKQPKPELITNAEI